MEKNKIIFLSDIHMSDGSENSLFTTESARCLTQILHAIAENPEIKELVLLGDVFDLWQYPMESIPLSIPDIIAIWDSTVINALKQCVARIPKVYYITGNHDMTVTQEDVNYISAGGKTIEVISYEDYNNKYVIDGKKIIHVEHGNSVDILNAPYEGTDGLYGLPIGFFLTRMYSTITEQVRSLGYPEKKQRKVMKNITRKITTNMKRELQHHHRAYKKTHDSVLGELFIKALIEIQFIHAQQHGKTMDDNTVIKLTDPDKDITIGRVKQHYHQLLDIWLKKWGFCLIKTLLVSMVESGLDWYAKYLTLKNEGRIIIMGHTHKEEWNTLCKRRYINDGAWCTNNKYSSPTYAEVTMGSRYMEMSLWEWNGKQKKKIGSRRVKV